jgi:hypothetical protein
MRQRSQLPVPYRGSMDMPGSNTAQLDTRLSGSNAPIVS